MNRPQPKKVVRPAGLAPRLVGAPVEPEVVPKSVPSPAVEEPTCIACGDTCPVDKNLCSRPECVAAREERKKQAVAGMDEKIKNVKSTVAPVVAAVKKTTKTKQPAYLKSVSHPVVPSADPEAPYGRDDNDRPIVLGRTDQQIMVDVLAKPLMVPQVDKPKPEKHIYVGALKDIMRRDYDRVEVSSIISEAELRRQFGLPAFNATIITKNHTSKFIHYPKLLNLTRQKLVELLDTPIDVEIVTETLPDKQRILKPTAGINTRIAELLHMQIQEKIEKKKRLIKDSEELIKSWSASAMKRERTPENMLDRKTREKFKYDERKLILQHKQEINQLRKHQAELDELQQRLGAWGSNPDDYELKRVTQQRELPVLFGDRFRTPSYNLFHGELPEGYDYGVGAYRQLVYLYNETDSIFRYWKEFENQIVLQAIGLDLIRPSKKLLKAHPSLGYIEPQQDDDQDEPDETENILILKTGGAQIGGGIYGSNEPGASGTKTFEKYDRNPSRDQVGEYGGEKPDNFYSGMDSGDLNEGF